MYKFVAITLVALSLAACGSTAEDAGAVPAPTGCTEGQVETVNDNGEHVCTDAPAVETPAVEADSVPAEGVTATADPVVAQ